MYDPTRTATLKRIRRDHLRAIECRHRYRVARRIGFVLLCLLALALALTWLLWTMRPRAITLHISQTPWRGAFDGNGVHQLPPTEGAPETYLPDWQYPRRPRGG